MAAGAEGDSLSSGRQGHFISREAPLNALAAEPSSRSVALPLPAVIPDARWVVIAGFALVAIGIALMLTGIITFKRHHTAVYPNRPASLVVDTGVYAYTRNPMYAGLTIAYLGGVLLTGVLWVLLLLPMVLTLLVTQVIRREERHLRERFPEEYAAYCARVGRWI